MRAARLDQQLAGLVWPEPRAMESLRLSSADVMIVCAGFEERSTEMLRWAVQSGSERFRVICVTYQPGLDANRRELVAELCRRGNARCEFVEYDRRSPSGAGGSILSRVPLTGTCYLDVSGMSRFLVVQLFAAAVRAGRWLPLVLLYVEAMEYPPSQQEVEKMLAEPTDLDVMMFLSTGVFGLTVVPELSSVAMRGQPIRVVAFPSWNPTQMAAICSEIQASYFTIVHGIPPDAANGWRPEALRRFNRIESLPDCHEIDVGTLDYRDTLTALLRLYSAHAQRERFVVVPTGSKMQAVAVGLLCGWLYDIQIAYPTPRTFSAPHDYTKGVRRAYRVDLGSPGATNVRPHQSRPVRG